MRTLSKVLVASLLTFGLIACSKDDNPAMKDNHQTNESVYLSFKLEFPITRSLTDNNGNSSADPNGEVGTDAENKVNDVQIILADPSDGHIIESSVENQQITGHGTILYTVRFQSDKLIEFADDVNAKPVNVFVYCNPYKKGEVTNLDEKFTVTDLSNVAIWKGEGSFFMSNANITQTDLPNKGELNTYNTEDNPFNLGTINVERAAARFDIATNALYTDFTLRDSATKEEVGIKLQKIALFNMSKECYNFRRVSDDGHGKTANNHWTLCGPETPVNYIVDTDEDNKVADNFFYTKAEDLVWTSLNELSLDDNWENSPVDYYFWRYAIENAIPQDHTQMQNIATGVAFRGIITAGDNCETSLKNEIESGTETLYVFNNILYGSWNRVGKAANGDYFDGTDGDKFPDDDILKAKYEAVEADVQNKTYPDIATAAKHNGFKVFTPNDDNIYEIYYNYYNHHNDNNDAHKDGPMEFAVVRNNVYKLRVTNITGFGDNEWVPPTETPIESDSKYFEVMVRVLPWIVRVNDIEF